MQPPALVEPASVSHTEQAWSSIAIERMSAARAVSRLVKLILRIASITGRASKAAMSTCSTVVVSSSALVLVGSFIFWIHGSARKSALPREIGDPGVLSKERRRLQKKLAPLSRGERRLI